MDRALVRSRAHVVARTGARPADVENPGAIAGTAIAATMLAAGRCLVAYYYIITSGTNKTVAKADG